jgi:hypothetical protein
MIELLKILPEADSSVVKPALESYKTLGKKMSYYSNPITSGKEYFNRCQQGVEINYSDLINFNLNISRIKIKELKDKLSPNIIVVNPSEFSVKGWNQDTYNYLWGSLIEKRVDDIYMSEEWEYSKGATFECLWGFYNKKNILDCNLNSINKNQALEKINKAIIDYKTINISTDFQENLLGVFK